MIGGLPSGFSSGLTSGIGGQGGGGIGAQIGGLDQQPGGGIGGNTDLTGGGVGGVGGIMPNQQATSVQGASFGDALHNMIIAKPSADKNAADSLAARFAAGDKSIDPGQLATATAKAGIEIQMSTRTISQAVQAVRTLFQMQI